MAGYILPQKGYPRNPRGLKWEMNTNQLYANGGVIDDATDWLDMQAYNLATGSNYSDLQQFREMSRPHLKIEREKREQEEAQRRRYAQNPKLAEMEDYAVLESWGQVGNKPKPEGYDEWAKDELVRRQAKLREYAKGRVAYLQNLKDLTIKSGNKHPDAWPEELQKQLDDYRSVMDTGVLKTLQGSLEVAKAHGGMIAPTRPTVLFSNAKRGRRVGSY